MVGHAAGRKMLYRGTEGHAMIEHSFYPARPETQEVVECQICAGPIYSDQCHWVEAKNGQAPICGYCYKTDIAGIQDEE